MSKGKTFVCPLCESTKEYKTIERRVGESGIGSIYVAEGYECSDCSIRFGDPDKFGSFRFTPYGLVD